VAVVAHLAVLLPRKPLLLPKLLLPRKPLLLPKPLS
jgi:hypothetical protein